MLPFAVPRRQFGVGDWVSKINDKSVITLVQNPEGDLFLDPQFPINSGANKAVKIMVACWCDDVKLQVGEVQSCWCHQAVSPYYKDTSAWFRVAAMRSKMVLFPATFQTTCCGSQKICPGIPGLLDWRKFLFQSADEEVITMCGALKTVTHNVLLLIINWQWKDTSWHFYL
jgi:hypothetical protein